jgi:hypothetical protein
MEFGPDPACLLPFNLTIVSSAAPGRTPTGLWVRPPVCESMHVCVFVWNA